MRPVLGLACLLAACAATEPAGLDRVEEADWRFVEPPPSDRDANAAEIRTKPAWTLDAALQLADVANPELAAERRNIDLATAALWQAKLYPNPAFVYALEEWPPSRGLGDSKMAAGVSLPLVVSDRIDAATRLAEADREIAAIEFLGRRRTLLSDVKRAFVRVLAAEAGLALAEETRDLARTLRETANERFVAQAVPEMEVLKATVSLARAEADLRVAQKERATAHRALLGLVGATERGDVRLVGELRTEYPPVDLAEAQQRMEESHPLLQAAAKRKEAAQRSLELERTKRWQDWDLDLLGGRSADAEFILEAGVRIPLPLADTNQAGIRSAEVRSVQADLELDAARNDLLPRVGEAYEAFMTARDVVEIFRSAVLPQATKAIEQTREGYRVGKFEYLDLLDAQRTLAEARVGYTTAVAELNESAATLEELTGMRFTTESEED